MVIYLPGQSVDEEPLLDELTPREIVRELDKHVVGQADAKRAVAIALRNRIRRQKLSPEMADEVMPKNILMIGPTGVGKTEIARRLAKLAKEGQVRRDECVVALVTGHGLKTVEALSGTVGPTVNLGNVAASALLGLETIRLGLRADTLTCFDAGAA